MARPEILLCFAVLQEARAVRSWSDGREGVKIVLTGIGPRNAEAAVQPLLQPPQTPPRLVISSGFAGGLNPEISTGTALFECDPDFPLASALARSGAQAARFHTVSRVATTIAVKQQWRESTQADAVDMESAVIRRLCRERQIPSATVRVISDSAREDLPLDFNRLFTEEWRLDGRRLAGALLRSPQAVLRLLRLQRQLRSAERHLAEVLIRTLESPSAR